MFLHQVRIPVFAATIFLGSVATASANVLLAGSIIASWYGGGERLSKHTSTGEVFNPNDRTAAHRTLPFGTRLRVCFRLCTTVRVNDRGPSVASGRSLDLSRGAAVDIGLLPVGAALVLIQVVK